MAESWVIAVVSWCQANGLFAVTSGSALSSSASSVSGREVRGPLGSVAGGQLIPWYQPASSRLVDRAGPDEAGLVREHDRLGTVAQVELVEQVGDGGLDGRLGEEQQLGDIAARETAADQLEGLDLAFGQIAQRRVPLLV